MSGIRHILVAVKDLQSKSHPAILKAAQLARACRAEIELFHCLQEPVYTDLYSLGEHTLDELERDLRAESLHRLEAIADQLRLHSIKVSVTADWDYPGYEAIIRRALRVRADLIVAARHTGRHTAPRLLRLTDWELIRLSPIPVLLVKAPHAYRHPAVLAAVDPTHAFAKPLQLDKQILHMARVVSHGLRGTLHAVHAYARMPVIGSTRRGSIPAEAIKSGVMTPRMFRALERRTRRSAKSSLARALRTTRVVASRRYLIANDPVSAIVEASKKCRSAIVVMGAVSRSGLKRLFIGNTAERILDELSCDILVVKPATFRCVVPRAARGARLLITRSAAAGYY